MRSTILFVEPLQRARKDCSFFKHVHGSEDSLVIEKLNFPSKCRLGKADTGLLDASPHCCLMDSIFVPYLYKLFCGLTT